VKKVR